ncbi:aKG-HExxH-type peptide beta-hydroxylase [Actinoplanes solisilvae]|uniref:aKG-HExxH-type peptide beta-hydroxylase n=1 Tax=Actinoplanes solisilvae TaxID=2486853 RepID=UPI0013E31665|nr:HEXXH motif-containing putative peptide modification protein [Actinoplanes solisilvae]
MSTVHGAGNSPPPVTVAAGILDGIARGGGGGALTELIRAQHSKVALLVRAIAELSESRPAYRALLAVADRAPEAVSAVLIHPSVLGWAMSTTARLHAGLPAESETLALVAAAAAVRGGAGFEVGPPADLPLPSLGRLLTPAAGDRLDLTTGGELLVNGRPAGSNWRPLTRLRITDRWSVRIDGVHSPLPPAEPLLDAATAERWRAGLAAGWRILADDHPGVAEDVVTAVRTVLPMPAPPEGHTSGTYRHAFGCLGMSAPQDPTLTALTLTHELHHLKLSGLTDLFELIEMTTELGYAPWRADPRPHIGLLHGAYAHLGVAAFWRRRIEAESDEGRRHAARVEHVRWREAALEVSTDLLATAPLTGLGRRFVTGMRDEMTAWRADPMPRVVTAEATRLNDEHRASYKISPAGRPGAGARPAEPRPGGGDTPAG